MYFYQLPNGTAQGFDNPANAPVGAVLITAEQFAQIALNPVLTLAQAQAARNAVLYAACQSAITSGFTSSALGAATSYPSGTTDQLNQHGAAVAGGQLQCEQGGVWALRQHTAAQATQVVADFMTWANKCQAQLVALVAQINAAATVAAAQAVVWTNPD